ncbi:MBL fold metallo-hydrolase [Terriglobus sp. TAA 43]|uniref:MBL fold metallo-hydrolase n=1 Tax=Terriglobus sp. TAA 43 TaxID=278961 RepID=UPI0006476EA7|nr:MBL fold metallo-hydrolase [Terriglobus sp. TAA 43]
MAIEFLATDDDELIRGRARVGDAEIVVCTDGTCLFDGGAMFGVVPKTLWSRKVQADEKNRVMLGLNCVVVKIGFKNVLIETGFGNKIAPKLKEIYAIQERLPSSLNAAGLSPDDIDIVINSHLHWDHCGWNSVLDANGNVLPYFSNAQYIAHRGEVEHGRRQWERDRISYVSDNYEPMVASGQMRLVDGTYAEVMPGITLECYPGHTQQCMAVHIESGGEHACFVSDLIPTSAHLDVGWVMGFDLDPLRTIEERKRFYSRALPEDWLILFPHDHRRCMTRLQKDSTGRGVVVKDY